MRYAICNRLTGYLALNGRSFRSQKKAIRMAHKKLAFFGMEMYELVLVEKNPARPISLWSPDVFQL